MKDSNILNEINKAIESATGNEALVYNILKTQTGSELTQLMLGVMVNIKFAKTDAERSKNQAAKNVIEIEQARRHLEKSAH